MRSKGVLVGLVAGLALGLSGCAEQAPAERPPEARATPKLIETPPEPAPAAHGPGDGHNHPPGEAHGPGDGHNHPGDTPDPGHPPGEAHGPGDGHNHPPAQQDATRHGYSADGKPLPHDPQGGDAHEDNSPLIFKRPAPAASAGK